MKNKEPDICRVRDIVIELELFKMFDEYSNDPMKDLHVLIEYIDKHLPLLEVAKKLGKEMLEDNQYEDPETYKNTKVFLEAIQELEDASK